MKKAFNLKKIASQPKLYNFKKAQISQFDQMNQYINSIDEKLDELDRKKREVNDLEEEISSYSDTTNDRPDSPFAQAALRIFGVNVLDYEKVSQAIEAFQNSDIDDPLYDFGSFMKMLDERILQLDSEEE